MAGAVRVFPDIESISQAAAELFVQRATEAISERGRFTVALSGGSTPQRLYKLLASEPYRSAVPWSGVHIFWGDERYVPPEHPDSNYRMVKALLLDHIDIPAANVHPVSTSFSDLEEAASVHAHELQAFFGSAIRFDLALMGMGSDGHTASLFPGEPALDVVDSSVSVARPASQPTARLTYTYPVFNHCRLLLYLVTGADKAKILAEVMKGSDRYPTGRIAPTEGELLWFVDQAAATELK